MCQDNNDIVPDLTKTHGVVNDSKVQAFEFHPSTQAAKISACVGAKYENGRICVNFPIIGEICFNVSLNIPIGASVNVCMETCGFRFGVPPFKGIKATVYFQNNAIWSGVIWGSC
ncbi:hypothetical protein JL193_12945 [Polaribacter batillariae]|uniref:Uncharacterized protein n=1 Tax=Polaribacter batillariae TaxID=2808900 RepID=A0ABX7SUN0_9FLAO|nr:hypothetical protein [Polaribacter batillariae]QTD37023.1 hypothetical protein JL193_12945 [Polaribacter batillariae]